MYRQVDSSRSSYLQQELAIFKQIDRELTPLYGRFREFHEQIYEHLTISQGDLFDSILGDFETISSLRDEIGFTYSLEEYLDINPSSTLSSLKAQLASAKLSYSKNVCDLTLELDYSNSMQKRLTDFLLETYKFLR